MPKRTDPRAGQPRTPNTMGLGVLGMKGLSVRIGVGWLKRVRRSPSWFASSIESTGGRRFVPSTRSLSAYRNEVTTGAVALVPRRGGLRATSLVPDLRDADRTNVGGKRLDGSVTRRYARPRCSKRRTLPQRR